MKKDKKLPVDDAFIREINEELKNDNLKKIWKKYGVYIVIFVALVLAVAVSFETFKAHQIKKAHDWSNAYAYAVSLQNQGRFDESLVVLNKIKEDKGNIYADIAKMQIANVLFDQGKGGEALGVLEEIVNDKNTNPKMHDIAVIKLASYKLDSGTKEEVSNLLNPVIAGNGSWANIAKEMMAMLEIREGNIETARKIYSDLLAADNLDDELKGRVKDILSILETE